MSQKNFTIDTGLSIVNGGDITGVTDISASGNVSIGNLVLSNNSIFDLAGPKVTNGDLTHGSTSGLNVVANGDGNATVLYNTYGNVAIFASSTGANVHNYEFGTDGNVSLPGNLSAAGNITANYLLGNGSQLSGISVGSADKIVNGTSNVEIPVANSNVVVNADGAQWIFDGNGNLTIPNGGYINFVNTGGITQAVNEDLRFTVSDDEEDGWAIQSTVNDGAGTDLTRMQVRYDGVRINTDLPTNNYNWDFRDTGEFDVPKSIRGPVGGNLVISIGDQFGSTTFIDLQTRSYVGDGLISNIRIGNPDVTVSTASGAYNWTFGGTGNLTVPGNIQSINTGFAFSSGITAVTNTNPAVIELSDNVFPDPVTGQVTISNVNAPAQANGTWYYQAVETNAFALYHDAALTQPVDATGWPGSAGPGGLAVSLGYSNLSITGGNVSIVSNYGEIWTFEAGGALRIPNDIVSNATIDLDNRASGNTADIRFYSADDIVLQARDRDVGSGSEGGDINIYAGDSAEDSDSSGGDIQIIAGNGGAGNVDFGGQGGFITIRSGDGGAAIGSSGATAQSGGSLTLNAGDAGDNNGNIDLGADGGDVFIESGFSTGNTNSGGDIVLTTGIGGQNGTSGNVQINIPGYGLNTGGTWIFDATGNLNLPASGNIVGVTANNTGHINWVGNSSGDSYGYTTMNLVPDNTVGDSYLIIDPTAPNHIHIRAGGTQDNSGSQLYLGGENSYFKVDNGLNPNVYVSANTNVWTYGTDGILTLPGEGVLQSVNDTIILQSVNGFGNYYSARLGTTGGLYFATSDYPQGWLDITNNSGDANITAAAGTAGAGGKSLYITAGAADQSDYYTTSGGDVNITGGLGAFNDGGGGGPGGHVNITAGNSSDPAGYAGNVKIAAASNNWVFDYAGNLTLPSNSFAVNYANGTPVSLGGNYGDSNVATFLAAYGSNTMSTTGNITAGNFIGSGANVDIAAGSYDWTFDNSGNLTAPGNISTAGNVQTNFVILSGGIVGSGASPAPYLSGFSTVQAVANITGGNILTGGLISSTGNITGNYILGNGSQLTVVNAATVDVLNTNGLGTTFYPTFVENRDSAEIVRADVDLTYRTDTNTLSAGNLTVSGTISATGNITGTTNGYTIGYRDIPQVTFSANATAALSDAGKHYYSTTAGNLALTLPDNSSVAFPTGATLTLVVNAAGNILVNQGTGVSLYMAGSSTTGNRVVGAYGLASVMKVAANTWVISGTGVY